MEAVLASRSDIAVQREAWLVVAPEQRHWFRDRLDHRICVMSETWDEMTDVGIPKWLEGRDEARYMEEAISLDPPWELDEERRRIPRRLLPGHLRWHSVFSHCPSGVVRFGHPRILDGRAYVFFDYISGGRGERGLIRVKRGPDGWTVVGEAPFYIVG